MYQVKTKAPDIAKDKFAGIHSLLIILVLVVTVFSSCSSKKSYIIYYGENCSAIEKAVCEDLRQDLSAVTDCDVQVQKEPGQISGKGYYILIGTPASSRLVSNYINQKKLNISEEKCGKQGGIIKVIEDQNGEMLVISGLDIEGVQNAVYDYSGNELGIDPFEYWTGYSPVKKPDFNPYITKERIVVPPVIPVICYFENDVDELANMKKPYLEYDMDTWRGMVNSLRRMHYNAIQIFDMFGRPEFYTREGYKKIRPDYKVNLPLIDRMIDYAHEKGMRIQVDLGLGYQMKYLTDEQSLCWKKYRKEWIDTWVYYLTQTPLKKADIYSMRPRNQIWDRAYISSCGENKTQVFNEVFAAFDSLLHVYKPDALKICICYDDGMELFNNAFNPPKDFIVVWSDDGYCDFKSMPVSTKGYSFGTYMHAGYWKNHTVHDPYPDKIDSIMTLMINKYNATSYLEVNGQTFRPFLINLGAFSQLAVNPEKFNGEKFYYEWCRRYFGDSASVYAVSSMKALDKAQVGRSGYVQFLGEIANIIGFLQDTLVVGPNASHSVKYSNLRFQGFEQRVMFAHKALELSEEGLSRAKDQKDFYYDYVYLPALMLQQLLDLENTLLKTAADKNLYSSTGNTSDLSSAKELMTLAEKEMDSIYKTAMTGDRNSKWTGWYDPAKRRPNNGFPTLQAIKTIQKHLLKIKGPEKGHQKNREQK